VKNLSDRLDSVCGARAEKVQRGAGVIAYMYSRLGEMTPDPFFSVLIPKVGQTALLFTGSFHFIAHTAFW
jgi:hypothetical protein